MSIRDKVEAAIAKPLPASADEIGDEFFDPWGDLIDGVHGGYASSCDAIMIFAMEAVRDRTTHQLIKSEGLAGEMALYILSGNDLTDYGTSPRGGWPDHEIADLWDAIIAKWRAYYEVTWGEDAPAAPDSTGVGNIKIGDQFRHPTVETQSLCFVRSTVDGVIVARWWSVQKLRWQHEIFTAAQVEENRV